MSMVKVRAFSATDAKVWDDYVLAHEHGTFFHRCGWEQVLREAFGHATYYLLAEKDGHCCGVLPLAHINSLLFSKALISTPFCVYGGALADDEATRIALEAEAERLGHQLKVDYVEYRYRQPSGTQRPSKDLYVTFRKEMADNDEANLSAIPRKQRAMVRKGIKAGLVGSNTRDTDLLFDVYSESVRNLGTPVFGRKYLKTLQRVFADDMDMVLIHQEQTLVAGVLNFYFRDEVLPYYGGGTVHARAVKGNDFLYWEVMQRATAKGLKIFDYGRSKEGTGSFSFKKNWGFVAETMSYEYTLIKAKDMPNLSPTNPKYALFIQSWQKLPLWLSQRIGPFLAKDLG